jgi:hypothetical protein
VPLTLIRLIPDRVMGGASEQRRDKGKPRRGQVPLGSTNCRLAHLARTTDILFQ